MSTYKRPDTYKITKAPKKDAKAPQKYEITRNKPSYGKTKNIG